MTQSAHRNTVMLLLGGARSGKSGYAQRLGETYSRVVFVATATAGDDEMRAKIQHHRDDRPQHWTTIEEPLSLANVISTHAPTADLILIDCLTLYAFNLIDHAADKRAVIDANLSQFLAALQAPACPIILISNEVGSGIVPAYALGRRYRDLLGEINQRVAAVADDVLLLVAGLPLALKTTQVPTYPPSAEVQPA